MREAIALAAGLIIASVAWMFAGLTDKNTERSLTQLNASYFCYSMDRETGRVVDIKWEGNNGQYFIYCKNEAILEVALILHKQPRNVLTKNKDAVLPVQVYIHHQSPESGVDITTDTPDPKLHYGGR